MSLRRRGLPRTERGTCMNLRRLCTVASILAAVLALTPSISPAQTLDQYGGYVGLSVPGGATGHFRVAKLNNRWMFATPAGNAFWMLGVYNVDVDEHVTDLGRTYKQVVIAKYGDADLTWGPQQNRRLKAWGFNTLGEYANKWTVPWTTINDPRWPGGVQPVQVPTIPFPLQGASYSLPQSERLRERPRERALLGAGRPFHGPPGALPGCVRSELRSVGERLRECSGGKLAVADRCEQRRHGLPHRLRSRAGFR